VSLCGDTPQRPDCMAVQADEGIDSNPILAFEMPLK
jgi:hypothetical protein